MKNKEQRQTAIDIWIAYPNDLAMHVGDVSIFMIENFALNAPSFLRLRLRFHCTESLVDPIQKCYGSAMRLQ